MWPFRPKPIWKEVKREIIRQVRDTSDGGGELFNVYAVHYQDLVSGKTKIEEVHSFA